MNINSNTAQLGLMWLSGILMGGGITYILTKKAVSKQYETILNTEIAQVKAHYALVNKDRTDKLNKDGDYETVEKAARKLLMERLKAEGYTDEDAPSVTLNGELVSDGESESDMEEPDFSETPYIISQKSYSETHLEYDKLTIIYFQEDEVLTDSDEVVIDEIEATVGNDNLSKFEDAKHESIIFVRNDNVAADFEIVLNKGSYMEIVAGIRNTAKPKTRRMPKELDE